MQVRLHWHLVIKAIILHYQMNFIVELFGGGESSTCRSHLIVLRTLLLILLAHGCIRLALGLVPVLKTTPKLMGLGRNGNCVDVLIIRVLLDHVILL
jgi:hypothetical protein